MNWEEIKKEFETSTLTMRALAEKHGVKPGTLRSRKNREKWQRNATNTVATKRATQRKDVATKKAVKQLSQNKELNEKQKQFCLLYLNYFNATKAYQEAYGVDYSTANSHGYRLLSNVVIKEELDNLKKAQRSDLYIDSLDIKREYVKQSFSDIKDFVEFGYTTENYVNEAGDPILDENGQPLTYKTSHVNFKNMEDVDGSLIQEIRMGKDGPVIKLQDKQKAMQELLKLLGNDGNSSEPITIVDEWSEDDE